MFSKIKEYFIGDLLRQERDTVRYANIEVVYYVVLLSLSLLLPLQVLYLFTAGLQSQLVGLISISVFTGVLFLIKRTGKILLVSHFILIFSTLNFCFNLFQYPDMNLVNGLMLSANMLFAFNLLGRTNGFIYSGIPLLVSIWFIKLSLDHTYVPFIVPVQQPVSVQISSFIILFVVIVLLILHYQSAHKNAALKLSNSLQALTLSEERRTKSQSVAGIGIWDMNLVSGEIFWDDETYRIFGMPNTKKLIRGEMTSLTYPEDMEYVRTSVAAAMEGRPFNIEYRIQKANGDIRVVNTFGEVQKNAEDKPVRFYGMIQDITERKHVEDEMKSLLDITGYQNTKLKNFAYIVSHNIRSHSANISSLIDFLDTAENEEDRKMFIAMLKTNAGKLEETLFNLNEIITVTEEVAKPKDEKHLKHEVLKTVDVLSGQIYQHKIQVEIDIPEDLTINVISSYLDSILLNLISNAVKYRSREHAATIKISAFKNNLYTVLSVKDNGLGIDLEKHGSKLFGMYKTFHKNEDARGMGLFITKSHIEAMKGKIEVLSKENEGTEFKVYFNEKG